MDESLRRQYLEAMGIQNWVEREAVPGEAERREPQETLESIPADRTAQEAPHAWEGVPFRDLRRPISRRRFT